METNIRRLTIVFVLLAANVFSAFSQTKPMNEMWGESAVSVDALRAGRGKLLDEGNSEKISFMQKQGWTIFNVPFQSGDTPASVVELTFKSNTEPADVDPAPGLAPNTGSRLLTVFADVKGAESKSISWMEKFGEWKHVTQISEVSDENSGI